MKTKFFLITAFLVILAMSLCPCSSEKSLNLTTKGVLEKIYRNINNEKKIIVDIRNDSDKLISTEINSVQDISTIYKIKIGNYAYVYQLGEESVISSIEMTPQRKKEYFERRNND